MIRYFYGWNGSTCLTIVDHLFPLRLLLSPSPSLSSCISFPVAPYMDRGVRASTSNSRTTQSIESFLFVVLRLRLHLGGLLCHQQEAGQGSTRCGAVSCCLQDFLCRILLGFVAFHRLYCLGLRELKISLQYNIYIIIKFFYFLFAQNTTIIRLELQLEFFDICCIGLFFRWGLFRLIFELPSDFNWLNSVWRLNP